MNAAVQKDLTLMPRLKAPKLREAVRANVESFYHLPGGVAGKCCNGTACFVARHLNKKSWQRAEQQTERVYCLGKCYVGPACDTDEARPHIGVDAPTAVICERLGRRPIRTFGEYVDGNGYRAFFKAVERPREEIIAAIEQSGLRGRGGAAFPTGTKWRMVAQQPALEKFVVANADEGDAGSYIDRFIIEDDPHCLIEAMAIAAYAVGAHRGFIYLRSEYPRARAVLTTALEEVRQLGLFRNRSDGFIFDIDLVVGKGSYLCGEESALLNSIEGRRSVAMARPPYAAEHGLNRKPTLINNVETLAAVPWILRNGANAYRDLGFSKSRGTKMVCLNSLFRRPGLYEVEFGVTVKHIVETLGGGLRTGPLKGVMIGGPLAGVIPPKLLNTPFGFEELRSVKASIGHGGIVAFDESTTVRDLVHYIFSFGAYESCGKCTPCRVGTRNVETMFASKDAGIANRKQFDDLVSALKLTSLCGHGIGLAEFAESIVEHYREELGECFG